jgi:hypothetical protein
LVSGRALRFAARPEPVEGEFLALKRPYDPDERFQSSWYRHYRALFAS